MILMCGNIDLNFSNDILVNDFMTKDLLRF